MSKWDIRIENEKTTYEDKRGTLEVEAGMCAIDFLEVDWESVRSELAKVRGDTGTKMIVHNRLRKPEMAVYYQFAGWVKRTVERIREVNPVYAENVFQWLRFEIERPYLTAYRGSEESFGVDRLWEKIREETATVEQMLRYTKNIRPSALNEMAAERILWFVDAYPAFPESSVFTVKDEYVQKHLNKDGELDEYDLMERSERTQGEEASALEALIWECNLLANSDDTPLNELTMEVVERLLDKLEPLSEYQEHLADLIGYVLDADGVPTVQEAGKRIQTLQKKPEYQALERTRNVIYRESAQPWNREVTPYQFSPLLIALDEFEWMCNHRKRKLRKCGHCGRYFISNSPKVSFCERLLEDGGETCKEFESRIRQESPDLQELERIHESARDSYKRRLRMATNKGTAQAERNEQRYKVWKNAAKAKRNAAMRGEISAEELREVLSYGNHRALIAEWERMEYDAARQAFERI